jgi:hypothetical protein
LDTRIPDFAITQPDCNLIKRVRILRTYSFSLTKEPKPPTIEAMDEQFPHDMQRYTDGGLSQTATTRKLEPKGFRPNTVQNTWKHFRKASQTRLASKEQQKTEKKWALRVFRFGFAGVFLINALVAWLQPQDFLGLMQKSLAVNWLGGLERMIPLIAVNDLALGIVILAAPKRYRPYVYAWSGLWFLAITIVKLTALNVFTS